jgi:hypothetical protein
MRALMPLALLLGNACTAEQERAALLEGAFAKHALNVRVSERANALSLRPCHNDTLEANTLLVKHLAHCRPG